MSGELVALEQTVPKDPKMVLTMERTGDAALALVACEMKSDTYSSRTYFDAPTPLDDVLVPEIVSAIEQQMQRMPKGHKVFTFPDFEIELPDLVLQHAHVILMDGADSIQKIIVRINRLLGDATQAYSHKLLERNELLADLDDLTIDLLTDIALPLGSYVNALLDQQDMSDTIAMNTHATLAARAEALSRRLHALQTYADEFSGDRQTELPEMAIAGSN